MIKKILLVLVCSYIPQICNGILEFSGRKKTQIGWISPKIHPIFFVIDYEAAIR
jgi:hypothetical protein